MTTENQIIIAEACGWTDITQNPARGYISGYAPKSKDLGLCPIPDYDSLDSMQQAVLAQDEEFQTRFSEVIYRKAPKAKNCVHMPAFHQLTVTDWQDSFVETLRQLGRLK